MWDFAVLCGTSIDLDSSFDGFSFKPTGWMSARSTLANSPSGPLVQAEWEDLSEKFKDMNLIEQFQTNSKVGPQAPPESDGLQTRRICNLWKVLCHYV